MNRHSWLGGFCRWPTRCTPNIARRCERDMPPQLLGNALIPTAIATRTEESHECWNGSVFTRRGHERRRSGLARWSCGEIGKDRERAGRTNCRRPRLTKPQQAQLLLGYLDREQRGKGKRQEGAKHDEPSPMKRI